MFFNLFVVQPFTKNFAVLSEKTLRYVWCVLSKPLLLHPLSKGKAAFDWHSDRNGVGTLAFFHPSAPVLYWNPGGRAEKWKKTSGKIWKIWDKVLTFAPAFETEASLIEILEPGGKDVAFFFFVLPFAREMTRRRKNEKKLPKNLEDILKSPYLCIRFPKEKRQRNERSLNRFT